MSEFDAEALARKYGLGWPPLLPVEHALREAYALGQAHAVPPGFAVRRREPTTQMIAAADRLQPTDERLGSLWTTMFDDPTAGPEGAT